MKNDITPVIMEVFSIILGFLMIMFNKKLAKLNLNFQNKVYKMGVTEIGLPFGRAAFILGGLACIIFGIIGMSYS